MPHQGHESTKSESRIGFTIDTKDELATAAQQLVERHIFDVTAIGQIQPFSFLRHSKAEHFAQQTGESWESGWAAGRFSNPKSETHVQESEQRGQGRH